MQYADIIIAALGVLALAGLADALAGRRGFFAAALVSGTGGLCGWFLCVRVFAWTTMDDWRWVACALLGSALALAAFRLFRTKR